MTNKKSIETQIKMLEDDCSYLMEQISLRELEHDKKQSEIDELKSKLTNCVSEYDNFVGTYWKINSTGHYFKILNMKYINSILIRECLDVHTKFPCIGFGEGIFNIKDFEGFKYIQCSKEEFNKKFNETAVKFFNIL